METPQQEFLGLFSAFENLSKPPTDRELFEDLFTCFLREEANGTKEFGVFENSVEPPTDQELFQDLFTRFEAITGSQVERETGLSLEEVANRPTDRELFEDFLARFDAITQGQVARRKDKSFSEEVNDLFDSFEDAFKRYLEENASHPPAVNVWEIADFGLDEVRNCRLLRWLLDPKESHCQGTRFLRCLLDQMGEQLSLEEMERVVVKREVSTAEADSRLDILVECDSFLICIEAKIQAHESEEQLVRYFETVGRRTLQRDKQFIGKLLTIDGNSGEQVAEGFTRLLWHDIASALKRFAGSGDPDDPVVSQSPFVRELVRQYADFLITFIAQEGFGNGG